MPPFASSGCTRDLASLRRDTGLRLGACMEQLLDERRVMRRLARRVFVVFLLTFIASRVLVILIMTRRVPNLFFYAGGTHVHHLNYGIFILSVVGAVLLFVPHASERLRNLCALLYGFAMALTFDEFGMWLHLGGSYWQRGSFDAVVVILSLLALLGFMPRWSHVRAHHWAVGGLILASVVAFYFLLFTSARAIGSRYGPWLLEIEATGPH